MRTIAITVIFCLGAVAGFNWYVDVPGFRARSTVEGLARLQKPGEVVASKEGFDQRVWIRGRLSVTACPEVVLLGSSTIGMLSASMFHADSVLNAWLSGPTIEDLEAVSYLLDNRSCRPSRIWIGCDTFLVNPLLKDERWRSLQEEQAAFSGTADYWSKITRGLMLSWATLREQLAYQTTRDSFRMAIGRTPVKEWNGEVLHPTIVRDLPSYCAGATVAPVLRHADGHFSQCQQFELPADEVEQVAAGYVRRDTHRIRSWPGVDEERLKRLKAVVQFWVAKQTSVDLIVPPYHPRTYVDLRDSPSIAAKLLRYDQSLAEIASVPRVSFINFRDPQVLGCAGTDFADSHHMRDSCAAKFVARARGRWPFFSPGQHRELQDWNRNFAGNR